jgi:O-antigen/teichoic acid export membrane protein
LSIRQHAIFNLAGAVLPIALSLITIPIYISLVGDERYGVLAIAWLLLGYFGLFDLGLGAAIGQRIAALAEGTSKQRAEIFWTGLVINSGIGVLGGLIIWPVAVYFFSHLFTVNTELRLELDGAIPWLILAVPLATLTGVLTGALQGRAKFLELNLVSVGSSVLTQLLPITVVWLNGPDLSWIIPFVIVARILTLCALTWLCRLYIFKSEVFSFSVIQAKNLIVFGGWITISSLIGPLMVMLDRFVIGVLLGAKNVTYYSVPFQLSERTSILSGALTSALFPRLAAASKEEANNLTKKAIKTLAVLMTFPILIAILSIQPFLEYWLNSNFASRASLTGQILLIGFWFNSLARVPLVQLQASGRPDLVAKCHLVELLPYLVALYFALKYIGLPGAALVFCLRTIIDCIFLLIITNTFKSSALVIVMAVLILFAGLMVNLISVPGSLVWWILNFIILFIAILGTIIIMPNVLLIIRKPLNSKKVQKVLRN